MNCILLAAALALGEKQCTKLGVDTHLEGLIFNPRRGGLSILCQNSQTYDSMYFGELLIKEKCIKFQ